MEFSERKDAHVESEERRRLRFLESEGKWVFHGSGSHLEKLEPRQAHNYSEARAESGIPDDKPAVFATPYADIAIFMAVVSPKNVKNLRAGFSSFGEKKFEFRATSETMNQLDQAKGYVYVFGKEGFVPRGDSEMLSYETVMPSEVIEVGKQDLPLNIIIKNF